MNNTINATVELDLDSGTKIIQRSFRSLEGMEEWVIEMVKNPRFVWGGNDLFSVMKIKGNKIE